MTDYSTYLAYLREQERHMIQLTHDWSAINSGSFHLEGLERMAKALADNFHWLGGEQEMIDLPPLESVTKGEVEFRALGQALRIKKRPNAPVQVFLGGHMDTVFGKDHPFQTPRFLNEISPRAGRSGGGNAASEDSPQLTSPASGRRNALQSLTALARPT
ncbi:MAG: hypothetical protein U1E36_05460 [Rickettsiales bacterium]